MAKINNIPTLTAYQQKFLAWQLDRRRSSSDEDKFTSVLAEAQVDLNPHQVDAALFAFKSPLSMGAVLADEVGLGKQLKPHLLSPNNGPSDIAIFLLLPQQHCESSGVWNWRKSFFFHR